MPTGVQTLWNGNAQAVAQVQTITVTAVPGGGGGTLAATCNGKTITYTTLVADTTGSATAAWMALLQAAATTVPEFAEVTWSSASNVLTMTASVAGRPVTFTFAAGSGATITVATTAVSSSPNDVSLAANWLRGGVGGTPALPQTGDDVVVANSSVDLLWNLDFLASVGFNSLTRWQDFTATVGLPEWNPAGYWEYRPTYFQFAGPTLGTLNVLLGQGASGTGPSRERYNTGSQLTNWIVRQSGAAADAYAVRLLGSNPQNVLQQTGTSVGIAMLTGEAAGLASAVVDGGGTLALGTNITYGGTGSGSSSASSGSGTAGGVVNVISGNLTLLSVPGLVTLDKGSVLTCLATAGVTFPSLIGTLGSRFNWQSGANISNLLLEVGSIFDKSADVQVIQIANATIDADSCQILDPNNALRYGNPVVCNNAVSAGPFTFGRGRKVLVI